MVPAVMREGWMASFVSSCEDKPDDCYWELVLRFLSTMASFLTTCGPGNVVLNEWYEWPRNELHVHTILWPNTILHSVNYASLWMQSCLEFYSRIQTSAKNIRPLIETRFPSWFRETLKVMYYSWFTFPSNSCGSRKPLTFVWVNVEEYQRKADLTSGFINYAHVFNSFSVNFYSYWYEVLILFNRNMRTGCRYTSIPTEKFIYSHRSVCVRCLWPTVLLLWLFFFLSASLLLQQSVLLSLPIGHSNAFSVPLRFLCYFLFRLHLFYRKSSRGRSLHGRFARNPGFRKCKHSQINANLFSQNREKERRRAGKEVGRR